MTLVATLVGWIQLGMGLIREVFYEFGRDDCIPFAGSLAFFTLFSFAPMLALVVDIASLAVGPELAQGQVGSILEQLYGAEVAAQGTARRRSAEISRPQLTQ